jgi:hypothetical protein
VFSGQRDSEIADESGGAGGAGVLPGGEPPGQVNNYIFVTCGTWDLQTNWTPSTRAILRSNAL